jgi:NAD(P)-dependent dehydrogenase (short-subunit alcohol dehydrogenase family)
MTDGRSDDAGPLAGRVALVTGASRGVGAAVAIALAQAGAHVVITARSEGGLEETDDTIRGTGGSSTLLPLDLAEPETIDSIGPSLLERFQRLDILVHAAASLGRLTPAEQITPADWTNVMAVNATAAARLIRTCASLLAAAPAGRGVFITDRRASTPRAYWGAYGAAKAAMEYLVRAWADQVDTTALRVNLFRPGPLATRLRFQAMPGEDQATLPPASDVAPGVVALCLPGERRNGAIIDWP